MRPTMRPTLRPGALARRLAPRLARWTASSLLAALAACAMTPLPVGAQPVGAQPVGSPRPPVGPQDVGTTPGPTLGAHIEGFVAQARLDPGLAGRDATLSATGARVLLPVARLADDPTSWVARRMAIGAFLTAASGQGDELAARHVGAQVDLRLTDRPLLGRVEPLLALGLGDFQTRRALYADGAMGTLCMQPAGGSARGACVPLRPRLGETTDHHLAVTPSLGMRVTLVPGLALRADARDVIVNRDGAQHNPELALGVSLSR
jgi:hypothetical protein